MINLLSVGVRCEGNANLNDFAGIRFRNFKLLVRLSPQSYQHKELTSFGGLIVKVWHDKRK